MIDRPHPQPRTDLSSAVFPPRSDPIPIPHPLQGRYRPIVLAHFFSTDGFQFSSVDYGTDIIQRRLKMDSDGNLRLYSRTEGAQDWYVSWEAMPEQCRIHGSCGPNSVCTYIPDYGRKCSCIPGFKVKNLTDWSLGCEPDFDLTCNQSNNTFLRLIHTEFYGYDLAYFANYTIERCANLCQQMCNCKGFQFRFQNLNIDGAYCFVKNLLLNGQRTPNYMGDFYVKLPMSSKPVISPNVDSEDLQRDCRKEMILVALKVRYRDRITILRGNHESRQITQV